MTNRDPKTGRFTAGASGNPDGRPKDRENKKTLIKRLMSEQHSIKSEDGTRALSTLELLVETVRNRALKGNPLDIKLHEKLDNHIQPETCVDSKVGVLIAPEPIPPDEWIEREEAKNLERKPPPEYFGEGDV